MITYTLTVKEKKQETEDCVTLCFKQPGLKKVKYLPGQYLTLTFRINGRRYFRPYSFSSAPGIEDTLNVTVKRVHGGIVSSHICDTVQVGDVIEVLQPLGDFVLPASLTDDTHLVLWGVGSGITPLFSIARWALNNHPDITVNLVYGNRNEKSVIFNNELKDLQVRYPLFKVWHFYTQLEIEETYPYLVHGRIQPDLVLEVMNENLPLTQSLHYICGPVGLKESVKGSLKKMGVSDQQVFSEDFEMVKNEADFTDITTRTVSILKDGASSRVEVVKYKSILEAGLDAGLELPYSCQTGNCSICKGRLLQGQVKQLLPRHHDLVDDEYQLCCTYPLSDNIIIDSFS